MADVPYRTPDGDPRDPLEVIETEYRSRCAKWLLFENSPPRLYEGYAAPFIDALVPALLEELRESRRRVAELERQVAMLIDPTARPEGSPKR
jgi:hypothetical protein